ncbi:phosphotransferase [Leifsonia kafniensis]|uniref:phosphotransferase n=1 Tax=Leifsonia kafniensis TaxID=475957 RepID=UPI0031E87FD7
MTTDGQRESTIGSPFTRADADTAARLLDRHWGIHAQSLSRLDTENDDTFRVRIVPKADARSDDPTSFILKLANPADDPAEIELQTSALLHARRRDPTLPLQRNIPSKTGELLPRLTLANGDVRIGRVLTYLPGSLLHDTPCTLAQLRAAGRMMAKLAVALRDFEHQAARRSLPWDLQQLAALQPKLVAVADAGVRAEMATVLTGLIDETLPRLRETRRQVIHNDFHGGNVIVDPDDPTFVAGILDFGDTVDSFLVADLAVAMSYAGGYPRARAGEPHREADSGEATPGREATPWAAADALRDGYCEITPLTPRERELLHPLAIGRLVQRYILGSWLASTDPANADYTAKNLRLTLDQFNRLSRSTD